MRADATLLTHMCSRPNEPALMVVTKFKIFDREKLVKVLFLDVRQQGPNGND